MFENDQERLEFLKDLDRAVLKDVEVSDWEAQFIESQMRYAASNKDFTFSDAVREKIRQLYVKYGSKV